MTGYQKRVKFKNWRDGS